MNRALLIFSKEPHPRSTKTRLAPALTPEERADFYEAMLHDLSAETAAVRCNRRVVCWTADSAGETVPPRLKAVFGGSVEWRRQRGNNLGARMLNALQEPLSAGGSAVLIGSDAPLLSAEEMNAAFESLTRADIVLAPCPDGGYGLVGARAAAAAFLPRLFENIPWSSPAVFSMTMARLSKLPQLSYEQRPLCFDIDTPEDLRALVGLIHGLLLSNRSVPEKTWAFLRGAVS